MHYLLVVSIIEVLFPFFIKLREKRYMHPFFYLSLRRPIFFHTKMTFDNIYNKNLLVCLFGIFHGFQTKKNFPLKENRFSLIRMVFKINIRTINILERKRQKKVWVHVLELLLRSSFSFRKTVTNLKER